MMILEIGKIKLDHEALKKAILKTDIQFEQAVKEEKNKQLKKQVQLDQVISHSVSNQVLVDVDEESGEKRDWVTPKIKSQKTGEMFLDLGLLKKGDRVLQCGSFLEFAVAMELPNVKKLYKGNFCKHPLCPGCVKRKSVKNFKQLSKVLEMVKEDYAFVFSTFTVKNCKGENLKETLDFMFKGWANMMKDKSIRGWGEYTDRKKKKKYKGIVKGFYRALEITYNKEEDTYHPHFHCILVVNKSYFKSKDYLNHSEWISLWERACRLDYEPIVDVRRFRIGEDGTFNKSVNEVAKYTTKDSDYLDERNSEELNKKVLFNLDQALFRRRLIAYGGILKDIHKQLNLDSVETGDLDNLDGKELDKTLTWYLEIYKFNVGVGNYFHFQNKKIENKQKKSSH